MAHKKYLNIGLIAFGLLGLIGFIYIDYSIDHRKIHHNKEDSPDAFVENIKLMETDNAGNIIRTLTAPKLTHFSNDFSTFENINLTIHSKDKQSWHVSAKKGRAISGTDEIHLFGGVNIKRPQTNEKAPMTITTKTLTIFSDEEIASTDQPIELQQPGTLIKSEGMRANLREGTVQLSKRARAEYLKSQPGRTT